MAKLTGIIRALEKREEALTQELRNVGAAIAALSGNGRGRRRRMNKAARKRIGRAVRKAWRKRKKLRA